MIYLLKNTCTTLGTYNMKLSILIRCLMKRKELGVLLVCQNLSPSIVKVWFIACWKKCVASCNSNIVLHHYSEETFYDAPPIPAYNDVWLNVSVFVCVCVFVGGGVGYQINLLENRFCLYVCQDSVEGGWSGIQILDRRVIKFGGSYWNVCAGHSAWATNMGGKMKSRDPKGW